MNLIKTFLITLAVLAGIALTMASFYAVIFIGIPIGIFYLVYTIRKSEKISEK